MKFSFFRIGLTCICCFLVGSTTGYSQEATKESTSEALYSEKLTTKSGFYNFLWGKHYRNLFSIPIKEVQTSPLKGENYIPLVEDYPYFQHYDKFTKLYNNNQFKGTYAERFIADAYTLIHPLAFRITNHLAIQIGENTQEKQLRYFDGKYFVSDNDKRNYLSTEQVIDLLHQSFNYKIQEDAYVRARLLDMITGNTLDINQSYHWTLYQEKENIYAPLINDRGFSFTKTDGLLFGILLKSLGIENIDNYYQKKLKADKINSHNLMYDLILSKGIKKSVWIKQADFIKKTLTQEVIDEAFIQLPSDFRNTQESKELKEVLIRRVENLDVLVEDYYALLQEIAVVCGTSQDDTFKIEQDTTKTSLILINSLTGEVILKNEYEAEKTKEIWLYGFGGIDTFSISQAHKNDIIIRIIDNDNYGNFELEEAVENIKIYVPESALVTQNEIGKASLYKTNNSNILEYNQDRPKKNTFEFQPGILFDTDQAIRLGGKFTYTRYKFKTYPFSARHELSWNHYYSFLYSGTFPTLSEKITYKTDLWLTTPNHFQNFFGFGNESQNYESSFGRDYNRVLLQRIGFNQGVEFKFSETQRTVVRAGIESYDIIDEQKFTRDDIFQEGELTERNNTFLNLKGSYHFSPQEHYGKFNYSFISEVGLMVNFRDMNRNVPFLAGEFLFKHYPNINKKYTVASVIKAKALFNEVYEFYQAATMGGETGLRGYRNERFSGQQYFVHSTDFRIDLGELPNKVIPVNYEAFLGFDYGRVWYEGENSKKWHTSFGGGLSLRVINKFAANISYFTSSESPRIILSLGYFF